MTFEVKDGETRAGLMWNICHKLAQVIYHNVSLLIQSFLLDLFHTWLNFVLFIVVKITLLFVLVFLFVLFVQTGNICVEMSAFFC